MTTLVPSTSGHEILGVPNMPHLLGVSHEHMLEGVHRLASTVTPRHRVMVYPKCALKCHQCKLGHLISQT